MTFRVVVSDQVFPNVELERALLRDIDATVEVSDGTVDGLVAVAADADAILNTYLPLDAATLGRLVRCRVIARYGIGVDNIDIAAARDAGIVVTNVPDYCVEEVAAHTLGLALAMIRRIAQGDATIRAGGWGIAGLRPIRRITGLTFGLIGYGRIARLVADHVRALGASIVVHDPFVEPWAGGPVLLGLDELLAVSDIVSVHAPSTPGTRHLIDAERIARMQPGAYLINTSRGPLVDLPAVVNALRSGHLGGAAIDVFEVEPLPMGSIDDVPGLIATPHMAYYSEESLEESQRKAATQVVKVLTGQPPDYPVAPATPTT
jgi:D-3-phosphoglycerate dehydrogenase